MGACFGTFFSFSVTSRFCPPKVPAFELGPPEFNYMMTLGSFEAELECFARGSFFKKGASAFW